MVRDSTDPGTRQRKEEVSGLLGMNIIGEVRRQLQGSKDRMPPPDTTSDWEGVQQFIVQEHFVTVHGIAKVAGKQAVMVPLRSVAMVPVTGWRGHQATALVEPIKGPLPGGMIIVNTVAKPVAGQMFLTSKRKMCGYNREPQLEYYMQPITSKIRQGKYKSPGSPWTELKSP